MNFLRKCALFEFLDKAHLRRKFSEAIPPGNSTTPSKSAAILGRDYCNKLFAIERDLESLTPEERYKKRLELEVPVWEAFWSWIESLNVLTGSALYKAVVYAKNQRPYLENYLKDGRCSISNNLAENAIRPFALGGKNWLFSDTPKGASASAAVYSIVETAKANKLNIFKYLEYILLYLPDVDYNQPEQLDDLMPWSERVIAECGL